MPANDSFRWNQKTLNAVFAISSVVMLLSVYVMMKQDQTDEWRGYQRTNFDLQATVSEAELSTIESASFVQQRTELAAKVEAASQTLDEAKRANAELFHQQLAQQRTVDRIAGELKFKNSDRDEARAHFDLAVRDALPEDVAQKLFTEFQQRQQVCDSIQLELDAATTALVETTKSVKAITGTFDDLSKELEKFDAEATRVTAAITKIKPTTAISRWKRAMMELPIIDGFNSHLKIVQDWMPKLRQTLGMAKIARFDRCRTCHQNIDLTASSGAAAFPAGHPTTTSVVDWVSEKKFPQPFATHSRPEQFATASSPHPVATFGCTICHDGQGSGTSFGNAEHSPNNPHQADEWHHEFGYHANHFWEYPMQPNRFAESTCIKCHHGVTELGVNPKFGASAPKVFKGYQLIQKYGCFGCHEINGYDAGMAIGPDMRVEPQSAEDLKRIASDPTQVAGKLRKVGPSFRHIASKTTSSFIQYWTEIPTRFRPSTKMPQFFSLADHLATDEAAHTKQLEAVELAGIAAVLLGSSEPIDMLKPKDGYQADAVRGKQLFSERGCLACHQHSAVPGTTADFGPNISDIHLKIVRNADNPQFSDWLYTWLREPQRYHARTRMPDLYLDAHASADGASEIDPAADITAFLLVQGDPGQFEIAAVDDAQLNNLAELYLKKARFGAKEAQAILASGKFPQKKSDVVGDEAALATVDGVEIADAAEWRQRKLEYVGRKSISRYGCYACHDMPGYESARPIGVALHDWGRKDTSKLGFEHIEEFLHHHGEAQGSEFSSTAERVESAHEMMSAGLDTQGQVAPEKVDSEMSAAYFYDSIQHHGRAGFIWQKLRGPRSYDFEKTSTKGYDERLRMPRFPLKDDEIEAIATFVLGLVAEPPMSEYIYTPDERAKNRIEGEFLLAKYNCTGCHMVELPKITFASDPESITATEMEAGDHERGLEMLLAVRPPRQAYTGAEREFVIDEEKKKFPVASFHGLVFARPDMEEDPEFREHIFDTWETLDFRTGDVAKRVLPDSRIIVPETQLLSYEDARGGRFAEWLVEDLMKTRTGGNRDLAWQSSPPPLYQEGIKVQTPWLYQFLLEPSKIRHTTVLRMPKFNMSPDEARTLANYFSAVDDAPFPYQEQGPMDADYLASREAELKQVGLLTTDKHYLDESWKTLNGPLCSKCHSFAGKKFKVSDPLKDIQGPNLNMVQNRLRADWVKLWLYKPSWTTPYTSMPVNFPKNNVTQFPDLFSGDPDAHITASRDALLNYTRLMDDIGPVTYTPPVAPASETPAAADAGADE